MKVLFNTSYTNNYTNFKAGKAASGQYGYVLP